MTMHRQREHALGEIAARFGLELRGDPGTPIRGVATLASATAGELGFLANPRYRAQLASTGAGAIVLRAADADAFARAALIADDPYVAFARIATLFERAP
ncbi:MAG TPA: LpxD N-terminal domain-containing protein, partial [Tahibacter sp.]|nr:LpxD N-terminal domain-containing protein [Tahibacter sp.]